MKRFLSIICESKVDLLGEGRGKGRRSGEASKELVSNLLRGSILISVRGFFGNFSPPLLFTQFDSF